MTLLNAFAPLWLPGLQGAFVQFCIGRSTWNVFTSAALACVLCGYGAYLFGGNEQSAAPPAESHYLILGQNLNALGSASKNLGGSVGVHTERWLVFHFFAGARSLAGNRGAFLRGHSHSCLSAYDGVRSLASTGYLPAHEQLFATDAQRRATVALTTPVRLSPLILSSEMLDFQSSETLTYKRFNRQNGAAAQGAAEMGAYASGNADYYDIRPIRAAQVPEGLLEVEWLIV